MQCEYRWYVLRRDVEHRYDDPDFDFRRDAFTEVRCDNEATEYTELPSAVKYDTRNVCKTCLGRVEMQERVNELVESGELWKEVTKGMEEPT